MQKKSRVHIDELEGVLEETKEYTNVVEYWAFKGAYQTLQMNKGYVVRRKGSEDILDRISEILTKYEQYHSGINFNSITGDK
jgi:hypothetical protein